MKSRNAVDSARLMVGEEGLEPSRIAPYASETYAYTSSATRPSLVKIYGLIYGFHAHLVLVYHELSVR